MRKPADYLKQLNPQNLFVSKRTREILSVNPTVLPVREEAKESIITQVLYSGESVSVKVLTDITELIHKIPSHTNLWLNVDGIKKAEVEYVCNHFKVHPLLLEDILSIHQRPKFDEIDDVLFCLLNMLRFNTATQSVTQEQLSIILGKNFVISFQEDASNDVFAPMRERLKQTSSKTRQRTSDYLCYTMLDLVVDNYFGVMESLSNNIEQLEEDVLRKNTSRTLARLMQLRKEQIVLKRNIVPVRDLLSAIIRSDSDILNDDITKYYKDVYDHIVQAIDLSENYRDVMMSVQDLYINNVNMKLNEVMKVMAIVTCLLAPATVIGGIFGMNFESIPYLHNPYGFWIAVACMLVIPILMIYLFKKRGWF